MTTALIAALRNGDRRALARAITLAESARPDHRAAAEELLAAALPQTGDSIRVVATPFALIPEFQPLRLANRS